VRVAALSAAQTFVKKLEEDPSATSTATEAGLESRVQRLIGKVLENTEDLKFSQVRHAAGEELAPCLHLLFRDFWKTWCSRTA
jgi:hypothetical protein